MPPYRDTYILAHELLRYDAATVALEAFALAVMIAVTVLSFMKLRTHGDPARGFVAWHKAACILFILGLIATVIQGAAALEIIKPFLRDDYEIDRSLDEQKRLTELQLYTGHIRLLLITAAELATFALLVSFTSGLLLARNMGTSPGALGRGLTLFAYSLASSTMGLVIARFGISCVVTKRSFRFTQSYFDALRVSLTLTFVIRLIILLLFVGFVATVFVVLAKGIDQRRKAGIVLLISSVLLLVVPVYNMAIYAVTNTPGELDRVKAENNRNWFPITDAIFGLWPIMIVLALIFVVGKKRHGGLWSTEFAPHK